MSKLLKQYNELKAKNKNKIYIFEVGIFYNILQEDAKIVSNSIGLKLTDLGPNLIKCGFPVSQLEKYSQLLNNKNIDFEVIQKAPLTNNQKASYEQIVKDIIKIDLNNTTCKEAFDYIYNIQQKFKNIQ